MFNLKAAESRHKSSNVVWQSTEVTKAQRDRLNNQCSAILWFTGLSGSGKSTLASAVEAQLYQLSVRTYVLDGDNMRHGLNSDLGFTDEDRKENIRRVGEVSKHFIDAGVMVLTSFISPFDGDRSFVRNIVKQNEFIEIYVKCPLNVCENRDPKGLYLKARNGQIKDFTGIDSPYEVPTQPDVTIDTAELSVAESVDIIMDYLVVNSFIKV